MNPFVEAIKTVVDAKLPDAADMPTRLGTIDAAYTSGRPRVLFDGEASLTGITQTYVYLNPYKPVAGQRVLLLKSGGTYVILGSVDEVGSGSASVSSNIDAVGRYYSNSNDTSATTTQGYISNTVFYVPVRLAVATKIDRIGINVTVAGATANLGRYAVGSTGLPGARVSNYGSVNVSTTGAKEITVAETIPAGFWYLALNPLTSNVTVSAIAAGAQLGVTGATAIGGSPNASHFAETGSSLPTTAAITSTLNGNVPVFYWRIAA